MESHGANTDIAEGVSIVDARYFREAMTACYVVRENDEAAIIDAGTRPTPDLISAALSSLGISPEQVRLCLITHAHLDHCAGLAELLDRCPNATAVAHEAAAPHLIDPFDKLWGASATLWGEDFCREHYSCVRKVDPARVTTVGDAGGSFEIGGGRKLEALYTPGHCWNHVSFHDPKTGTVFTGDSFGVSYREFDAGTTPLIFPTSPPNQFKPEVMAESIRRMLDLKPERLGITHFGVISDPAKAGTLILERLEKSVEISREIYGSKAPEERLPALTEELRSYYMECARDAGSDVRPDAASKMLTFDAELNSKGYLYCLEREEQKGAAG